MDIKNKKIAIVTDWLTNIGGGEKVLKIVTDIFPHAPVYATVYNQEKVGNFINRKIKTSFLQKIPFFNKRHQFLLPWLPLAIESFDLSQYDIILSFSSSVAKSVLTHPHQIHICYIHSPMRYAWEPFFDNRIKNIPSVFSPIIQKLLHRLRLWDKVTSTRPDYYIANSAFTQKRVRKYYRRDTDVLYPPVDINQFSISDSKQNYYLGLGRMVHYKKFNILIETFKKLPKKTLILVGDGPERNHLEKLAEGYNNIIFSGQLSNDEIQIRYSNAKAFLLPQKEDAGIVQLEAMASGTPVIAFASGGILDVIQEKVNGLFFYEQTPESLIDAIERFEKLSWDPKAIRDSIRKFDTIHFKDKYLEFLNSYLSSEDNTSIFTSIKDILIPDHSKKIIDN